jgi:hypothetical protein
MGVSGRRMGVSIGAGTTMGILSRDACGRRTVGMGRAVSVTGGDESERTGIGGSSCCRRALLMMVVEGGAWDRRRV